VEIIAYTLRLFGTDGIKVAVEVSVMAADAGLIPTDGKSLPWAKLRRRRLGHRPEGRHMNNFFDLEIREILAKPRQKGEKPEP